MRLVKNFIRNRRGQALVELALALPLLILLLMATIEFGRIMHSYILITNGSREGARTAVVGADNTTIVNRVNEVTSTLNSKSVVVEPDDKNLRLKNTSVRVTVNCSVNLITPVLNNIVPNPINLTSATSMRMEN